MLKHHLLIPHSSQQHIGTFHHYLSLGSHSSPYTLRRVRAFSVITLNPKEKLPTIAANEQGGVITAAVPLKGRVKIDSKTYQTSFQQGEKVIWSPKDISTVEEDQHSTTFAYVAMAGTEIDKSSITLQQVKAGSTVQVHKAMVFVVSGRMAYREGDIEAVIKNKLQAQQMASIFYTSKCLPLLAEEDSIILIVKDQ